MSDLIWVQNDTGADAGVKNLVLATHTPEQWNEGHGRLAVYQPNDMGGAEVAYGFGDVVPLSGVSVTFEIGDTVYRATTGGREWDVSGPWEVSLQPGPGTNYTVQGLPVEDNRSFVATPINEPSRRHRVIQVYVASEDRNLQDASVRFSSEKGVLTVGGGGERVYWICPKSADDWQVGIRSMSLALADGSTDPGVPLGTPQSYTPDAGDSTQKPTGYNLARMFYWVPSSELKSWMASNRQAVVDLKYTFTLEAGDDTREIDPEVELEGPGMADGPN